jgi:hypothetical protein
MKYYFTTNESGLIISKLSTLSPLENEPNFIEISENVFDSLFLEGKDYVYIDSTITERPRGQTVKLDPTYATIMGVKLQLELLIELQSDILGGAL